MVWTRVRFQLGNLFSRLGVGPRMSHEEAVVRAAFDIDYYKSNYPDVASVWADPVKHFIKHGWIERRNPTPDFDTGYYMDLHPDVEESGINPFYHYLVTGKEEGRLTRQPDASLYVDPAERWLAEHVRLEFDAEYYLRENPDVSEAGIDPLVHYVCVGWKEGRNPSPRFSVRHYLEANTDIADAGVEPFSHYIAKGRAEGRIAPVSPEALDQAEELDKALEQQKGRGEEEEQKNLEELTELVRPFFDPGYYLRMYPDVAELGEDPLQHYLVSGWQEGRRPSIEFDTQYYLRANPDVRRAGVNPLVHFAMAGSREGRETSHPGGHRAETLRQLETLDERVMAWKRDDERLLDKTELVAAVGSRSTDRVVISISHDVYHQNVGGVQACISEEQRLITDGDCLYVHLAPAQPMPILFENDWREWAGVVSLDGELAGAFGAEDLLEVFCQEFAGSSIKLLFHALQGHCTEWLIKLHDSVPVSKALFWVHDYFSICPGYNLLRNDIEFCGAPAPTSNACGLCVYGERRSHHLKRFEKLFERIGFQVIAPSRGALELWSGATRLQRKDESYIEHRKLCETSHSRSPAPEGSPLRVAFLGHDVSHKGWPVFIELADRLYNDERYELFWFSSKETPPAGVELVSVRSTPENPEQMQQRIAEHEIDIALILSNWPETFCLTAYEAIAGGAMVIALKGSGNVADLVEESGLGAVFGSEQELLAAFESGQVANLLGNSMDKYPVELDMVSSGVSAPVVAESMA